MKFTASSKTVSLCSMANFINQADRVLMPIAIVQMTDKYNWSLDVQGWILSSFAFGYISSQVIGGKLAQSCGGKNLLAFAVLLWSTATFMTPFTAPYLPLLILSRIILGFAEGLGLPTIFHIFANTVPMEERSRAFGYLVALGSIGQSVAAVVCPTLPWQVMFFSFGTLGYIWSLAWILFYHDNGDDQNPELLFQPKINTVNNVRWSQFLAHWPLWAIYTAHFAMNWSNYIILQWLPTYLSRILKADKEDLSFTALPYIANSLVGVAAGHYADYLVNIKKWTVLSVRRTMTNIGLLAPAVLLLVFSRVGDLGTAVCVITLCMGLGACNSAGHLSNHADVAPNHAGITFAVSNTLASIPGITSGPLTAAIVSHTGSWNLVFIIATVVNFVGAGIYNSQSSASQCI